MPTKNPDRARSRFLSALRRIKAGVDLQHVRIVGHAEGARRVPPGSPWEVVDLTGVPDNDLDYYIFELARLRDTAREMIKVFGKPPSVVAALAEFDQAVPKLNQTRNPLIHPSDDDRLDNAAWMSALVNLNADGSVEYLVDPRYEHHDAAVKLIDSLNTFLRTYVDPTI